eukprot:TRINITY_DN5598_c0_g1_i1.p1 TRINITY_DN5598_c0_g1~~TRINITY_DN5598_c0_g1_i1.p1  ORF type:complete len:147 (-),score=20.67 TRINITY_DN5598_c0_g1_i1:1142-1582(-)
MLEDVLQRLECDYSFTIASVNMDRCATNQRLIKLTGRLSVWCLGHHANKCCKDFYTKRFPLAIQLVTFFSQAPRTTSETRWSALFHVVEHVAPRTDLLASFLHEDLERAYKPQSVRELHLIGGDGWGDMLSEIQTMHRASYSSSSG